MLSHLLINREAKRDHNNKTQMKHARINHNKNIVMKSLAVGLASANSWRFQWIFILIFIFVMLFYVPDKFLCCNWMK